MSDGPKRPHPVEFSQGILMIGEIAMKKTIDRIGFATRKLASYIEYNLSDPKPRAFTYRCDRLVAYLAACNDAMRVTEQERQARRLS